MTAPASRGSFAAETHRGAATHAGQYRRLRSSRRRPCRRFHPVRSRAVLYRSTRLARRGGGEDRKSQDGRSWTPAAPGSAGRRPVLFPRVQREQEVDHAEPEIAAWPATGKRHAATGGRVRRELRARDDRAAGSRLRRGARCQSADHLRAGEGLRRGQPVREKPGVRHDRAGLRRHVQRHRCTRMDHRRAPAFHSATPAPAC